MPAHKHPSRKGVGSHHTVTYFIASDEPSSKDMTRKSSSADKHKRTPTNSCPSDRPAVSSVPAVSEDSRFDLEKGYPSILRVSDQVMRNRQSLNILQSLEPIFAASFSSILRSMDSLPEEVRLFPDYELARHGAVFTYGLLTDHMKMMNTKPEICDPERVPQVMELAVSSLKHFLKVAGVIYDNRASLSPSPKTESTPEDITEDIVEDIPEDIPEIPSETSSEVADEPAVETVVEREPVVEPIAEAAIRRPRSKDTSPTISRQSSDHRVGMYLDDAFDVFAQAPETHPTKELPGLPVDPGTTEATREVELVNAPKSSTSDLAASADEMSLAEATLEDASPPVMQRSRSSSFLQRARNIRPAFATLLPSSFSKSSITLVGSISNAFTSQAELSSEEAEAQRQRDEALSKLPLPDIPYILRNSAAYFVPDPLDPDVDVEMPALEGETMQVQLLPTGEVKSASLTAIIRMVTSRELLKNPKICQNLLFSLSHVVPEICVVTTLRERFHEQPPPNLDDAQLRVWTREAMTVRIRVGHLIILWLEQYWNADADNQELIARLQKFVLDDVLGQVPDTMGSRIVGLLEAAARGGLRRGAWLKTHYYDLAAPLVKEPQPTGFEVALTAEHNYAFHLSQLDMPEGKKELARQLTIQIAALHKAFDPQNALHYWSNKDDKGDTRSAIRELHLWERSLYFWIIDSVLAAETKEARLKVLQFWVDVGIECIAIMNFGCGTMIYGALISPPVDRLKETLLVVDTPHKDSFKLLEQHFSGFSNYGLYREAIEEAKDQRRPYIPILSPLIRDIDTAKNGRPSEKEVKEKPAGSHVFSLLSLGRLQHAMMILENGRLPFKFVPIPYLQTWLTEQLGQFRPDDENALNQMFDKLSASREERWGCGEINAWLKIRAGGQLYDLEDAKTLKLKKSKAALVMNRLMKKTSQTQ
ncbi:hypothetical protein VNI00_002585 [Paramarasmius palmivorus]|uniref:Ras GEF n=1 Tax=Paramarasmius palmivorus TaxID=297713 RepID=A0AAW0DWW5_9AGAR